MIAATRNSRSTLPAARASTYSASIAIGSSTSWIQRGTTTRGGGSGAGAGGSALAGSCPLGAEAGRGFSETPVTCRPPWAEYV